MKKIFSFLVIFLCVIAFSTTAYARGKDVVISDVSATGTDVTVSGTTDALAVTIQIRDGSNNILGMITCGTVDGSFTGTVSDLSLSSGTEYKVFVADYEGGDWTKETFAVPCTHTETEVKNAKAATCVADGYTGDTYCKSCGVKISSGTAIKAAGHRYDAGKVTKEPTVDAEGVRTYTCTVCGATKTEAIAKLTKPETPAVNVSYHTHIQDLGDSQGVKTNGQMAGTSGKSKRLENIWIKVDGNSNLGIQYSTHCQNYGWMPWSANGEANGTSGEAKRLEAIKIQLTGADADKYDVYYRVHAQNYGWLAWVSNGAPAGTAGCSLRLEGIQVVVVKKGEAAPGLDYADVKASAGTYNSQGYINKSSSTIVIPGNENTPNVMYRTHVQNVGWQNWKYNGDMSGTSGRSLRLEGINIKLSNCAYSGGIRYTTHIQNYGWSQGWKSDGEMSGTSGESKRLEAIKIELTGELANHYDVYYRVHAQNYGWLAWAKNGEEAGTEGLSLRLEGIQIVIVPKGEAAPSIIYGNIISVMPKAFIKK